MEKTKQCSRCKQVRLTARFSSRPGSPDGMHNICKDCHNARTRVRRSIDPTPFRENELRYRLRDTDRYRSKQRAHWERHKQAKRSANRAYRAANLSRCREWVAVWTRANKSRVAAATRRRIAASMAAVPKWGNREAILSFYETARRLTQATGTLWTVDYVVPLQSALVCGLHCETNLQVMPGIANFSKCNRWWPDMPEGS